MPLRRLCLALLTVSLACASYGAGAKPDVVASNIDASVSPSVDFFAYANGGWLKRNPIPASEASWGIGNMVNEELYVKLRTINEQAVAAKAAEGTETRKIGDFWTTAMDTELAEKVAAKPLAPELARVDASKSVKELLDVAFSWKPLGVRVFFAAGVSQDEKNSESMAVHLYQGGLGLPERDFYFNPEAGLAKIREEYVAHLARVLVLLGRDAQEAAAASKDLMAFETELARASRTLADLRDPQKNYNKMTPGELMTKHTPDIDWSARLPVWGLKPETVIVGQPEFFATLNNLLNKTPLPVLKDYLRAQLVRAYASTLNQAFDEENFHFYGQVLSGKKEQRARWKRVLDAQEDAMGMMLGRLFVQEYFPDAAKKRYSDMVEQVRIAYRERIDKLEWMSEETKAKARVKLAAMTKKVGYPDKWKDYSALVVSRASYCENMMHAARWQFQDNVSKFGKPVDRDEWDMTPQTYNAYYNPSNNEIVLPAAIFMIPGFADAELDDAVVYGYAGASTIGHEITHGFDDEGRQFDEKGNLTDWWTAEDAAKFTAAAEVMVKQFDAYEPLPGLHINGRASLGENIADYGGLLIALDAFRKTEQYKRGEKLAGFTPLQRYFLGYSLGWLSQQREQNLRDRLLSDVHSPAKWRVLGPFANIPAFHEAFGVKEGQPMWRAPKDQVKIW